MTKLIASSAVTAFTKPDAIPGVLSAGTAASLLAAVGDLAFVE